MNWHPAIGTPDPTDAWIGDKQLDAQRTADEAEQRFEHMLARRERFHSDVTRTIDPTPEELAELWRAADQETY